jgi:hypothetical protein
MEVLMGAHRIAATIAAGVLAVGLGERSLNRCDL